jgi:iron complex outermembrane receptor protein
VHHRFRLKPLYLLILQSLAVSVVQAQEAVPASAEQGKMEVVTIFGQGQTRQVQNISRDDLVKVVPGTSPLKTLEKLPGVSFQSADPFGAYEWSTRFSIRGFNQNQLGFTLDGVPLGDMSYGANNGLHVSRAIISENIGRVSVSQGAGSLATASTSNLGGTVQFFTLDPSDTRGLTLGQTFGSDNTSRTFVRLDSGKFESGTKLYLSALRQRAEKSKGWGPQNQDQFNVKVVHSFGDNRISAFLNTSDRTEVDYADMAIEMVKRLGYDWDNYAPNWQRAIDATKGIYSGGVTNLDDAYFMGRGLRKDHLGGISLNLALNDSSSLKTTIYHHDNKGQGHWYTPYPPAGYPNPIAIRTTEYTIVRDGVVADYALDIGSHSITAGFWGERSLHGLTRNFYSINGPEDMGRFLSNPFATGFKQDFTTTTTQYYLADTITMMNGDMKLNFGFKSPKTQIHAVNIVAGRSSGDLTTPKKFLPQAGLNYSFSKDDEMFLSAAQNMRAYQPGVNGPFSQTQAAFNQSVGKIKPETSVSLDLGYRFKRQMVQGSVSVYRADFSDRLLNVQACSGIAGCPNTFVNVGKVATQGVETALVLTPVKNWSWFNSFTYNDSKYKSDYLDASSPVKDANGNGIVRAAGKQVVDTAKILYNTELSYENEAWFTRLGGKYTDKRYYTYLNDIEVPAFWVANLSAGYKMRSYGMFKDLSLQVNVTNLFAKQYFSTIGSNGFVNADPTGSFATLLSGAPRQVFVSMNAKL